ncbi:dehydrogenase [Kouleothrix aurantiaca]|uniref:Dehydrogenase n=1 Tax=Kouleothrix aurantiaca TaxID=186479 RepID=A0A0P9DJX1_9CHLR|nr:dehydrogenase [Kouleothrix aurantiaca]
MNVFVAGATGALGKQLVPRLVAAGHSVVGMTRTEAKREALRAMGATPVLADALDREQVMRAVAEARPDAIIHELTALSGQLDMRHFDRAFAQTNRLRTEGTDNLLAAGRAAGVRRFLAQSYAGWPYARVGALVKGEDEPFDPNPPAAVRDGLAALRHLEDAVTGAGWAEGIVLRYGGFYGPGTSLDGPGSEHMEAIRKRMFPLIGDGGGVWSFIHIADAAEATLAALEHGRPGIYNIVDDEPARAAEWLPALAQAIGAKPPRRMPLWLGRLLGGEVVTIMMTEVRGASNAKARRELGWAPKHPSLTGTYAERAV